MSLFRNGLLLLSSASATRSFLVDSGGPVRLSTGFAGVYRSPPRSWALVS
jgi:hypothetical protein